MNKLLCSISAGLLLFLSGASNATLITQEIEYSDTYINSQIGNGGTLDFNFTGLVNPASSDLTVELWVRSDLNSSSESVTITADSGAFSFGNWLNNNSADDIITDTYNDIGTQGSVIHFGSATMTNPTFNSLLSDGQLSFNWNFSNAVNDFTSDFAKMRISYEVSSVPEPGSILLLGLGLAGLVTSRKRK